MTLALFLSFFWLHSPYKYLSCMCGCTSTSQVFCALFFLLFSSFVVGRFTAMNDIHSFLAVVYSALCSGAVLTATETKNITSNKKIKKNKKGKKWLHHQVSWMLFVVADVAVGFGIKQKKATTQNRQRKKNAKPK